MALGPFLSYVPPNVYTRTLTEANAANLVAGLRIPAIIGVGQEELEQDDLELVRGSSSTVDQQIVNEDVSLEWVVNSTNPNNLVLGAQDGTITTFRVRNFPIVDGVGNGRTTNDVRSVSVTVNGSPVSLGAVQGAKGLVTLQVPTQPTDVVRCTYFFHRGDTVFVEDLSAQVDSTNATLTSPGFEPFAITAAVNDQFIILVNGVASTVTLPAGSVTAANLKATIDTAAIPNLSTAVFTDNEGRNHLRFVSPISLTIGAGTANGVLGFTTGTTTNRNRVFKVYNRPIVDGSGGGITTTDPSKVVAKINNVQVVVSAVDGANGNVTLPYAPSPGASVTIQYWANTWQDTFDYLPESLVTSVLRCGISAGRSDYIQGTDFVVSNPTSDISMINWGASFSVAASQTSPGATPFDGPTGQGGQIVGTLVDDQLFLVPCTRVVDTTTIPSTVSTTEFLLPEVPTTGNGRNTPLGQALYNSVTNSRQDLVTNRPDLVRVYTGRTLGDALNRSAVTVTEVDGANRQITLKDPVPPDWNAYATFYYSRLIDDTYIFTNLVAGPMGAGQYSVLSSSRNENLYEVKFGTKSGLSQTIQWPRGVENIPDACHTGAGAPVSEIVTVTFGSSVASSAVFTNRGAAPYSFYAPASATWVTAVNGGNQTTTLSTAVAAYLVGGHVSVVQSGPDAGKVVIPAAPANVLNISIDGVAIDPISLTSGNRTAAAVVAEINAAIDANASFSGTAPNNLCSSVQIGPATGDVIFIIKSKAVPAALPGGFDSPSAVTVTQGTVETALGFRTGQTAVGTPRAINKPATLLGTAVGPFNITTGVNDTLVLRVDGVDYSVTLPAGAAVAVGDIVTAINTVTNPLVVASAGTLANLNHLRLTSPTNDGGSSIVIGAGTANTVLGFSEDQTASFTLVTAQEVVNELMATAGFAAGMVARVTTISSNNYITFESLVVGTGSSIGFASGANSAFNSTTGIGLTPGVDGDVGEAARDNFTVTSSAGAEGSSGTGTPGQTYTDALTGLRFTVLPAQTGSYTPSGYFTLEVSQTFNVDPSVPRYSIGGLELIVSNTVGVGVNDTATVQTYNPSGVSPNIGDFYYLSYRYLKQDFSTRLYQQLKTIEANFGKASPENRVTLASYLSILNGAVLIAIKQVRKVPDTNQASDQSFNTAIDELATPLPGNVKPSILVPLATSTAVYSHLTSHCEIQSNVRNQNERMGFIGFASGTSPSSAQAVAKGLVSSRIVAFYPDSAVITLTDELGRASDSIVDGTFFGAAVAGAVVSPAVDVATPYTRRRIQGFTRIPRIMDPVEANQTAVAGVTILEDLDPIIRIRHGLTTNMKDILTRLPTVVQISDYVQQQSRAILDSFVGTKFLASRTNEVVVSMTGLFRSLVQAEIVGAFTGLAASIDPNDPTILNFEGYYTPIFPLQYLVLTFNLRTSL